MAIVSHVLYFFSCISSLVLISFTFYVIFVLNCFTLHFVSSTFRETSRCFLPCTHMLWTSCHFLLVPYQETLLQTVFLVFLCSVFSPISVGYYSFLHVPNMCPQLSFITFFGVRTPQLCYMTTRGGLPMLLYFASIIYRLVFSIGRSPHVMFGFPSFLTLLSLILFSTYIVYHN